MLLWLPRVDNLGPCICSMWPLLMPAREFFWWYNCKYDDDDYFNREYDDYDDNYDLLYPPCPTSILSNCCRYRNGLDRNEDDGPVFLLLLLLLIIILLLPLLLLIILILFCFDSYSYYYYYSYSSFSSSYSPYFYYSTSYSFYFYFLIVPLLFILIELCSHGADD